VKRIVWVAVVIILFLGSNAGAFFLRLDPVREYTDNTAIEPTIGIFIDAWVDGSPLAVMFPQGILETKIPLIDNTFGAVHTYRARTHLSDGRVSADYTVELTSPFDDRIPLAPGLQGVPLLIVK